MRGAYLSADDLSVLPHHEAIEAHDTGVVAEALHEHARLRLHGAAFHELPAYLSATPNECPLLPDDAPGRRKPAAAEDLVGVQRLLRLQIAADPEAIPVRDGAAEGEVPGKGYVSGGVVHVAVEGEITLHDELALRDAKEPALCGHDAVTLQTSIPSGGQRLNRRVVEGNRLTANIGAGGAGTLALEYSDGLPAEGHRQGSSLVKRGRGIDRRLIYELSNGGERGIKAEMTANSRDRRRTACNGDLPGAFGAGDMGAALLHGRIDRLPVDAVGNALAQKKLLDVAAGYGPSVRGGGREQGAGAHHVLIYGDFDPAVSANRGAGLGGLGALFAHAWHT